MAIIEAKIMLCLLLQKYTLKIDPTHVVTYMPSLTMRAKDGIKIIFEPRSGK